MDRVQCPICGKMIDPNELVILDNGNPVCPQCAEEEDKDEKTHQIG